MQTTYSKIKTFAAGMLFGSVLTGTAITSPKAQGSSPESGLEQAVVPSGHSDECKELPKKYIFKVVYDSEPNKGAHKEYSFSTQATADLFKDLVNKNLCPQMPPLSIYDGKNEATVKVVGVSGEQ